MKGTTINTTNSKSTWFLFYLSNQMKTGNLFFQTPFLMWSLGRLKTEPPTPAGRVSLWYPNPPASPHLHIPAREPTIHPVPPPIPSQLRYLHLESFISPCLRPPP